MKNLGQRSNDLDIIVKKDVSLTTTSGTEVLYANGNTISPVTRDTAQTISSIKTFSSNPVLNNTKYLQGKNTGGSKYNLIGLSSNNTVDVGNTSETLILQSNGYVRPHNNGGVSLGTAGYKWKDIYISGQLADGNNANYGLVLPDTSGWTANKTIATTDSVGGGVTLRRWL